MSSSAAATAFADFDGSFSFAYILFAEREWLPTGSEFLRRVNVAWARAEGDEGHLHTVCYKEYVPAVTHGRDPVFVERVDRVEDFIGERDGVEKPGRIVFLMESYADKTQGAEIARIWDEEYAALRDSRAEELGMLGIGEEVVRWALQRLQAEFPFGVIRRGREYSAQLHDGREVFFPPVFSGDAATAAVYREMTADQARRTDVGTARAAERTRRYVTKKLTKKHAVKLPKGTHLAEQSFAEEMKAQAAVRAAALEGKCGVSAAVSVTVTSPATKGKEKPTSLETLRKLRQARERLPEETVVSIRPAPTPSPESSSIEVVGETWGSIGSPSASTTASTASSRTTTRLVVQGASATGEVEVSGGATATLAVSAGTSSAAAEERDEPPRKKRAGAHDLTVVQATREAEGARHETEADKTADRGFLVGEADSSTDDE